MAKKPAAKKTAKKTAAKKKSTTKTAAKKTGGRKRASKSDIRFFMGQLVLAGYLGKEIPKGNGKPKDKGGISDAKAQGRAAQSLRQMSERLAKQIGKFEGGSDDEDDED